MYQQKFSMNAKNGKTGWFRDKKQINSVEHSHPKKMKK
jgi:hypothetical protein